VENRETQNFIKEVAKYFMTFLETDFKKRRLPKRHTNQKTVKGNKIGIDIEKYPALKKILIASFFKGFSGGEITVDKGRYTHTLPESLKKFVLAEVDKIDEDEFNSTVILIAKELKRTLVNIEEYDILSERALDFAQKSITKSCLTRFLTIVNGPLSRAGVLDENARYQIEVELIDAIFEDVQSGFLNVCQAVIQEDLSEEDVLKELGKVFVLKEVREVLKKFFNELEMNDFFDDLYQLYRNNAIVDKTELYFYFYEISFDKDCFPVFYVPLTVTLKQTSSFTIEFDKRIFVNTRAVEYVVQEFNKQNSNNASLAGAFDRIVYVENEENVDQKLKSIITQIAHFFQINADVTANSGLQRNENLLVATSNKCYLYLSDKSDEALINDYEAIIDDDSINDIFSGLIDGFVKENPTSVIKEIDDEWSAQDSVSKLVFESPVPLNEEQKRVLAASQKKDCSFMILEGPPGTGKSHTITAIICKALLEKQTVLVLSDKKEALDVVEDKITQTLNAIRRDDDFQNPILRIGKAGNKFAKIVQGQTVEKIKEHYRTYRSKNSHYETLLEEKLEGLKQSISQMIDVGKEVEMKEIFNVVQDDSKYEGWGWFAGVPTINEGVLEDLLSLKLSLDKIRNKLDVSCPLNEVNFDNLHYLQKAAEHLNVILTNRDKFDLKNNAEILDFFVERQNEQLANDLVEIFDKVGKFKGLENKHYLEGLVNKQEKLYAYGLRGILNSYKGMKQVVDETIDYLKQKNINISFFSYFKLPQKISFEEALMQIEEFLCDLKKIKLPLLGFLFSRERFLELVSSFKKDFLYYDFNRESKEIKGIESVLETMNFIEKNVLNKNSILSKKDIFQLLVLMSASEEEYNTFFSDMDVFETSLKDASEAKDISLEQYQWAMQCFKMQKSFRELGVYEKKMSGTTFAIAVDYKGILFENKGKILLNTINEQLEHLSHLSDIEEELNFVKDFAATNIELSGNLKLDIKDMPILKMHTLLNDRTEEEITSYVEYVFRNDAIKNSFENLSDDSFADSIGEIEQLVAAKMAHFIDGSIIDYIENNASDVNTLKLILRKKQKFPKELFEKMKKAFPCILAGIRDYAEYIPLSEGLFDLIIIDEASQVSIAQALPALIRGKKVIVLGDDKQFSNVKAQNASTNINNTFKSRVRKAFLDTLKNESERDQFVTKVEENFNIKNSILKFVRFIRNYECILRKHFRCYPEIISYSNKYFYDGYLQCMKIRGCPVEDVIKFDILEHDGLVSQYKNINEMEGDFIVDKLKEFVANGDKRSIGIISPHREQVQYLADRIYNLTCREQLLKVNKLKIMTFDTCQGEERDYVF